MREKLADAQQRLDTGAPFRDSSVTLAAWLDEWVTTALPASSRKQATVDLYTSVARKHLVPSLGRRPLHLLRPSDVEAVVLAKRREGLSASTVRTIYTVLRAALDTAVRDGLLRDNPAAKVRRPTAQRKEAAHLDAAAARRLLDAVRGDRLEALFRLMLATGLRRGEALALHWSDVDLDRQVLRVRWTLNRTSRGLELGEPKTTKSRRNVPLPTSAVTTLRSHRERQHQERTFAGDSWVESDFVFSTEIGTALEPRNVLRRFEQLARRAGLQGVSLHTLRHTAASLLLAAGTHTKVVQEHLGHSSYAITADIYSHVTPAQQREAADRLDDALPW
ncbi:site-specific integrase [uncultured Modestobacter sp.]|uniref:tyrosine-type recombinase/integrase n=1 Tax=uncultured Modestobacter sp. TaxID=380048 RepID=UPI00261D533D|nr:site-specific integrase [uncultured Modestobacter sp.]